MLKRGNVFLDVASQVGWEKKDNARGIALADLDNDGDLDVLMTHQFLPVSIFRNDEKQDAQHKPKNWVGIKLQGNGISCNRDAIGTRVDISYQYKGESITQMREVVASNGLSAQNDMRLLFGLDDYQGNVKAMINWCGKKQSSISIQASKYHLIVEPK